MSDYGKINPVIVLDPKIVALEESNAKLQAELKELRFKHERLLFRLNQINTNGHPTVGAWHDLMWEIKRLAVKP